MTTELQYLTYTVLLTALCWIPYIINTATIRGFADAMGYPTDPKPIEAWGQRMKAAHYNAVENLVIFAPLILIAHTLGISNEATALSAIVYFWARLAHLIVYALGIPVVRTLFFAVAFAAQLCIAYQILSFG